MSDAIERVIGDVERYSEAGERLAARLLLQSQWNRDDIERLRSGVAIIESCRSTDSAARSRGLTQMLADFEQSRRSIQASVVLALLEDGTTIAEIGQVFGVSRQLANRLVKDAHNHYPERSPVHQPSPTS